MTRVNLGEQYECVNVLGGGDGTEGDAETCPNVIFFTGILINYLTRALISLIYS